MATQETMLVLVSATDNSNKFYHVTLDDNNVVTKRYGRVGTPGVTRKENTGDYGYDKIIREKKRKGYKETAIVSDNDSQPASNAGLGEIAKTVLLGGKSNSILEELVDTLVRLNNHDILEASGGLIKVNSSGLITTPLGLIDSNSIHKAKGILSDLERTPVTSGSYIRLLEDYLSVIPQKVGSKRGWHEKFFEGDNTFAAQRDFLKQLNDSLTLREDRRRAAVAADSDPNEDIGAKYADLFKFKIDVLDDKKEFDRINRYYESKKTTHHRTSGLKIKRIFTVHNPEAEKAYEKKVKAIGNPMQLWHGTGVSNILSILRSGLYCPPVHGTNIRISGRMFGHGVYFSDISSKSSQYLSFSGSRSDRSFMFLADVALGNTYHPNRNFSFGSNRIQEGGKHDSIYAQGGKSGVLNNEMIVWNTSQISMRYLCELGN